MRSVCTRTSPSCTQTVFLPSLILLTIAEVRSCKPTLLKGISKNLAPKAQATPHREALVGEMHKWAVCKLSDGQIDGKNHGGQIENSQQNDYDCSISCGHAEGAVLAEEDPNGPDAVFADGSA